MHTHYYKMESNGHTVFNLFFFFLINILRWFNPWVILIKIPWRRKWQPTPAFLLRNFHGQRSLAAIVHGITRVGHD